MAEKKNDMQFQLQQHIRTISNLHNTFTELEKKKEEAIRKSLDMETLANEYEERNFELEEREMEVRYRLQMLESVLPALILWNVLAVLRHIQQRMEKYFQITSRALMAATELPVVCKTMPTFADEVALFHAADAAPSEILAPQIPLENEIQFVIASGIRRRGYCRLNGTSGDTKLLSPYRLKTTNERVYAQTLQQVDELITNMESEFKKKLADMENTLVDKRWKLEECERKLAMVSSAREIANHLSEKTLNLEMEIVSLKSRLKSNEEEKISWQRKERDFVEEIERLNGVVGKTETSKLEILEQLEKERTANKEFADEMAFKKKEIHDLEAYHADQVNPIT